MVSGQWSGLHCSSVTGRYRPTTTRPVGQHVTFADNFRGLCYTVGHSAGYPGQLPAQVMTLAARRRYHFQVIKGTKMPPTSIDSQRFDSALSTDCAKRLFHCDRLPDYQRNPHTATQLVSLYRALAHIPSIVYTLLFSENRTTQLHCGLRVERKNH